MMKTDKNTRQHSKTKGMGKQTLEKITGQIQRGQERDTGNIGCTRHRPKPNKANKQYIFIEQLYYFVHDALHISEHQHLNLNRHTYVNMKSL